MAHGPDDGEIYDQVNVVPMLDLAYVLIVVFILIATATIAGLKVDLPRAANRQVIDVSQTQSITVTQDGDLYLNGAPTTLEELEAAIRRRYSEDPDVPVVIRGDGKAAYAQVVEVIDLVGGVGVSRISLPADAK